MMTVVYSIAYERVQKIEHNPIALEKSYKFKNPTCVVCSTEKFVKQKVFTVEGQECYVFLEKEEASDSVRT